MGRDKAKNRCRKAEFTAYAKLGGGFGWGDAIDFNLSVCYEPSEARGALLKTQVIVCRNFKSQEQFSSY
ncbi:MAG: hypothetical protein WA121_03940 [Syntrophales bacterium]